MKDKARAKVMKAGKLFFKKQTFNQIAKLEKAIETNTGRLILKEHHET